MRADMLEGAWKFIMIDALKVVRTDPKILFIQAKLKKVWYVTINPKKMNYGVIADNTSKLLHQDSMHAVCRTDWNLPINIHVKLANQDSTLILPVSIQREDVKNGRIYYDNKRIVNELCQLDRGERLSAVSDTSSLLLNLPLIGWILKQADGGKNWDKTNRLKYGKKIQVESISISADPKADRGGD